MDQQNSDFLSKPNSARAYAAVETIDKASVFSTMEDDITAICRTDEERKRTRKFLEEAEEQSKAKRIKITRTYQPLKQFISLWKIRFHYGIHWSKPLYPFRLARNIIMGKLYNALGKKKFILRGIEFAITFICNFKCNHCLCARIDESQVRNELEPAEYDVIVRDAMKLGATTFGMEGGEPFVKKNWEDILNSWQPKYNHIIISSNGFLFDEKKAKRCAEIGVDTINFSLDSGIPELHDAFRKKRHSFKRVMEAISLCRKYGIKVIINTVVHKGSLYTDGFHELLEFCEREKLLLNTLFAKGVGAFKDKDVMMDQKDIENYHKIIGPYNYVQRHLNYNYGKQFGCPGTKEMINMTPYGDVMNCANMHVYFGNTRKEPLKIIRDRAINDTPFGNYSPCFLADDPDFMNIYYGYLQEKPNMSIDEFKNAALEYEKKVNRVVYPEYHSKRVQCGDKINNSCSGCS